MVSVFPCHIEHPLLTYVHFRFHGISCILHIMPKYIQKPFTVHGHNFYSITQRRKVFGTLRMLRRFAIVPFSHFYTKSTEWIAQIARLTMHKHQHMWDGFRENENCQVIMQMLQLQLSQRTVYKDVKIHEWWSILSYQPPDFYSIEL